VGLGPSLLHRGEVNILPIQTYPSGLAQTPQDLEDLGVLVVPLGKLRREETSLKEQLALVGVNNAPDGRGRLVKVDADAQVASAVAMIQRDIHPRIRTPLKTPRNASRRFTGMGLLLKESDYPKNSTTKDGHGTGKFYVNISHG